MNSQEVFAAQFFVADVADYTTDLRAVFDFNSVHSLHVSLHEILVAEFFVADFAVA